MGIYDREYYRKDGPSFLDSLAGMGRVCKWLILINIAAYILQLMTLPGGFRFDDGWFTDAFILNTRKVLDGQVWRVLTYSFLHSPTVWQHIVFNLLFLWWFGHDVEDVYGPREFLAFYLTAATLGGLAFVLTNLDGGLCLGASGAVTAVMVLCALHFPSKSILLFFVLPVPIWLFVIYQVAQDTFIFTTGAHNGVAVVVHLTGALFAFVYYKRGWRLLGLVPDFKSWQRERARPRLRVYRAEEEEAPEPVSVGAPPPAAGDLDEQLEAKLDAVLEKVARFGQASLTDNERQILFRASEVYKRRRT